MPYVGGNPLATNSWASNIAFGNDPNMVAPDSFPTPDNMVDTDPMFVDLDAANYALQDGSPAIGSGEVVPFWQQQTPGAVDIGACAHGLTSCP